MTAALADDVAVTTAARSAHGSQRAARTPLVVVRPAPHREPPFDDEIVDGALVGGYDQRLPFDTTGPTGTAAPAPRPHELPDPATWGRRLLVGLVECADGRRPLQQLAAMLSLSVGRGLGADLEHAARVGDPHWLHRAGVRRVRACEPVEGVAELAATVEVGPRVRAVAMRLELHRGRWQCTRLQLG